MAALMVLTLSLCFWQAGLASAAAAVFLPSAKFGENLETSTIQNPVNDIMQPPEEYTGQFLSEVCCADHALHNAGYVGSEPAAHMFSTLACQEVWVPCRAMHVYKAKHIHFASQGHAQRTLACVPSPN